MIEQKKISTYSYIEEDIAPGDAPSASSDGNNWEDLKTLGPAGELERLDTIDAFTEIVSEGWVGKDDEWDYLEFSIEDAAKLSFNVTADDATKFIIYSLKEDNKGRYSLKTLQSSTLKLDKAAGQYTIDTKGLLLTEGTYYIGVQSTKAKKGGGGEYTISLNDESVFYSDADNSDDWGNLKTHGSAGDVGYAGEITETWTGFSDWAGFSDQWDYKAITLEDAAKLSFSVTAEDGMKFVIYSLKQDKKGRYSLKALQSSSLKKDKATGIYSVNTKDLLLEEGTYYIGVQSVNAKKGGGGSYTVSLNSSTFFDKGDDGSDNYLYDSKKKVFNDDISFAGSISRENALKIGGDTAWVGFGDEWDYYRFSVDSDMDIMFDIYATDAVKMTICQVVNGKVKNLQTVTVKADSTAYSKKLALSEEGEYYIGVRSANAKKGGSANYSISGSYYIKPLDITISGISDKLFDEIEEFERCKCEWNYDEYTDMLAVLRNHYCNCTPAKAKYESITGTEGADVVTFLPNLSRYYKSIDLGGGNDSIIIKDSNALDNDDSEIETPDFLGETYIISLGAGDDLLYVGSNNDFFAQIIAFGSGSNKLTIARDAEFEVQHNTVDQDNWEDETFSVLINFGDDDDIMTIGENSEVYCTNFTDSKPAISFGGGNDQLIGGKNSTIYTNGIDFGAGDDLVDVKAGMEFRSNSFVFGEGDDKLIIRKGGVFYVQSIDFGEGNDTLVLDGTLIAYHGWDEETFTLEGLENLSGSGCFAVSDYDGQLNADQELIARMETAGITVINVLSGSFKGKDEELADNTMTGLSISDGDAFWLCGKNVADSVDYGFEDSVDYIKFEKNSELDEIYGYVSNMTPGAQMDDFKGFSLDLLDSQGKVIADLTDPAYLSEWGNFEFDFSRMKNGTYYLRLATAADSAFCGYVGLDD